LAQCLVLRGWHVVAVARTVGALEELDDRIKFQGQTDSGAMTLAPMDITNNDAMRHLCASIYERFGYINLWAHTAIHAAPLSPAAHLDAKDIENSIATNIRATASLIPMVEPLLKAASDPTTALFFDDARAGQKFFGAYGATKAAQIAIAQSWAAETVKTGPRVVIESPAPMATAIRARFFPGEARSPLIPVLTEAERIIGSLFKAAPPRLG
jgi:NAD(P)-dependent dehydrogenase (short-subunit alcohol dehydrogenase family)